MTVATQQANFKVIST